MKFKFLIEPWMAPILLPFGATADQCFAQIQGQELQVKMGKLFDESLDISQIHSAEPGTWNILAGLGHRIGLKNEMGVLASTRNVVKIHFKSPQFIKMLWAFHFKTTDFYLALEEPEAFIQSLEDLIQS